MKVMKMLFAAWALVSVVSCGQAVGNGLTVWYDKSYDTEFGVVCYKTAGGAMSCVKVTP